jgi:hypothetical protein
MRAIDNGLCRSQQPFIQALVRVELGDETALQEAAILLDRLPAISRRRLLLCYNGLSQQLRQAS